MSFSYSSFSVRTQLIVILRKKIPHVQNSDNIYYSFAKAGYSRHVSASSDSLNMAQAKIPTPSDTLRFSAPKPQPGNNSTANNPSDTSKTKTLKPGSKAYQEQQKAKKAEENAARQAIIQRKQEKAALKDLGSIEDRLKARGTSLEEVLGKENGKTYSQNVLVRRRDYLEGPPVTEGILD